jgi:hypothetical protein
MDARRLQVTSPRMGCLIDNTDSRVLLQVRLPGKQTMRWSSRFRRVIRKCFWDL